MLSKIKFILIGLFLVSSVHGIAQFTTGFGLESSFLQTEEVYNYNLQVYNENETFDLYRVNNALGISAQGLVLRSFGGQFQNPKKVSFGYSLEIGYQHFVSRSNLIYRESSTRDADSIVNAFEGVEFKTHYHLIRFNHFFDVHWNPNERIKITNSFGVGLGAIVRASLNDLGFDGSVVNTNHPILRFNYQPQITEKYARCAITYYASVDLFALSLFTKAEPYETPDFRIPFSSIRFNTFGIRIIPYFKRKKVELPEEE